MLNLKLKLDANAKRRLETILIKYKIEKIELDTNEIARRSV